MSQLANLITYAAAHMTMRRGDIDLAVGSGFVYRRKGNYYFVTAWHNLTGRNTETLEPIDRKTAALPDNIVVGLGFIHEDEEGIGYYRNSIIIPLYDEVGSKYLVHEQAWPRVDVAVIPIMPNEDYNFEAHISDGTVRNWSHPLQFKQPDGSSIGLPFLTRELEQDLPSDSDFEIEHTIGDDLFLIGFPAGVTDHLVNPIWKRASFASKYSHKWMGQKMFVVDSASRKGMSGCVALYFSKTGVVPVSPGSSLTIYRPICILHGVYAGRYGDSEFEAQIGRVWKMDVVDEIIDSAITAIPSEDIELPMSQIRSVIRDEWPRRNTAAEEYISGNSSLYYFRNFIMEKINGRSIINIVMDLIVEVAKERIKKQAAQSETS